MITKKELIINIYTQVFCRFFFFTLRINEFSVMSASVDDLFKYGKTTSYFDLVGFIVNLLVLTHLKTLARSWFMFFFPTRQKMSDRELYMQII